MKMRGSAYFLIVVIVIMLAVIVAALRMDYFEAKLLPITYGTIILILAAISLKKELASSIKEEIVERENETGSVADKKESWRKYVVPGAWILAFLLTIYLINFIIAITLFVFLYMKTQGARWITASTFAILTPVFIYVIFEVILKVYLHQGLLFKLLGY